MASPHYAWIVRAGIVLYLLLAGILIHSNPGLQHDEALQALGTAHMLHSTAMLPLPQDPDTWIQVAGRWMPMMTVRYVGATKEYLLLPLFAWLGPSAETLRWLSALLGAVGIWGLSRLLFVHVTPVAGACTAVLLAVHPGYLNNVVFDNGTVAAWMAAFGLLCIAISRYLKQQTATSALWIGLAIGLGIWARANFVWMLAALCAGTVLSFGRQLRVPLRHCVVCAAGALAGGSVFLLYQIVSAGGTFTVLGMFQVNSGWGALLARRWEMLSEVLLLDRERRAIWGGSEMPAWQSIALPLLVAVFCAICLISRDRWKRASAVALITLLLILFTSRMLVAEHHMVVLVPLAAAVAALGGAELVARRPGVRVAVVGLACIYIGCCVYWQAAVYRGLRRTGGHGPWSDGIYRLDALIRKRYPSTEIRILDWGLQNGLFVLSGARLRSLEIYPHIPRDAAAAERFWKSQFESGGVYLTNGAANRQMPQATSAFLKALADYRPTWRKLPVTQRDGSTFAEVIEVEASSAKPAPAGSAISSYISTGDPAIASQLDGFHNPEESGWRWTRRQFAVTLAAPDSPGGTRFVMEVYVPDAALRQGPVTLTPARGARVLAKEVFAKSGRYTIVRDLEPGALAPGGNRFDLALDKALPPTPSDKRELGIIVVSAWLEAR